MGLRKKHFEQKPLISEEMKVISAKGTIQLEIKGNSVTSQDNCYLEPDEEVYYEVVCQALKKGDFTSHFYFYRIGIVPGRIIRLYENTTVY